MQKASSSPMSIDFEDMNSVETAYEPSLNELGLRNWRAGHGLPACPCTCCCSCCAAAGGEASSE